MLSDLPFETSQMAMIRRDPERKVGHALFPRRSKHEPALSALLSLLELSMILVTAPGVLFFFFALEVFHARMAGHAISLGLLPRPDLVLYPRLLWR
jgi:hypothetical protein